MCRFLEPTRLSIGKLCVNKYMLEKMEDLLQSQIRNSCNLALPNGLKELMWDISREVLRAQPQDLCEFITRYLSALLVTRENLTVAAKVCDETCQAPCQLTLEDKLRDIGLNEEYVEKATKIINQHLQGPANEGNLLLKLMRKTNLNESMLPAIQQAIRSTFVQQHVDQIKGFEHSSDQEDDVTEAVSNTMRIYENTSPTNEEYNQMATKIQAAYRAYGVRRALKINNEMKKSSEIKEKALKIRDDRVYVEIKEPKLPKPVRSNLRASVTTESSTSLAGSYVKLPKYTPYSAHDVHAQEEILEKVHSHTDSLDLVHEVIDGETKEKRISFEALTIDDDIQEAGDESDGIVEELVHEGGDEGNEGDEENEGDEGNEEVVEENEEIDYGMSEIDEVDEIEIENEVMDENDEELGIMFR